MMKKIVAYLFFIGLFLLAVALVAPGFIDWSKHKDSILSQIEPYLARKIEVGGHVSFRILPNPQIMLQNVTLANAEGAKDPHFMKLKQLEARMKMGPLLQGKFEIETINLAEPEVNLETLPDGRNNWTGIFRDQISARPGAVQLNNISMTGGTLHFRNAGGGEWQVENLNLTVTSNALAGPYKIKGDMRYNNAPVAIEAGTSKYETGQPVPLSISFTPSGAMPRVSFSGVADFSNGIDLQGETNFSQGSIASLFNNDFLGGIDFLNETADGTAMLSVKPNEVAFTGIKTKVGKKGEFAGSVTITTIPGQKTDVTADLTGSDLKVTSKPVFLAVPETFVPHLKAKAKSLSWNGNWITGLTIALDANGEEWVVKEARIDLAGKSKMKLAGTVTPKTKYAQFSLQATSEDVQKMLQNKAGDNNILKPLGASGLLKKLDMSANVDLRADKVSLSNIDATLNGASRVNGVLNIRRGTKQSAFDANLNFDKGDVAALVSDAYAGFMGSLMKSDATLNITVKDFTRGELKGTDFAFKGRVDDGMMQIESMDGTLGSGSFHVGGKVASLNPLAGMDIDYTLKAPSLGGLKEYGVEVPPPLSLSQAVDVKGTVKGDAGKYAFIVEGTAGAGAVSLEGTATAGNQGTLSYQTDVNLKNASWSQIGLPIDSLVADAKTFSLKTKLSGTRLNWQLDNIDGGGVTGTVARKDGKYTGDLDAASLDFDKWLWEGWKVTDQLELKLRSKKMEWRNDEISNAQLSLEAGPNTIHVEDMKGEIWGGGVTAEVTSERKNGKWKGALKGRILDADLQKLAELMELKGFTVGRGDLTLDLTDDDSKTEKNWFAGMDGTVGLQAKTLTVDDFSPAALAELVAVTRGAPSDNFNVVAVDALRSASTTYKNVEGTFKFGDGKISIEKLRLGEPEASTDVTGHYELGPESFKVSASVKLRNPAGAPAVTVSRGGAMENAPSYALNVKALDSWLAKRADEAPPERPQIEILKPDMSERPIHETVILPEEGPAHKRPVEVYPQDGTPALPSPHDDDNVPLTPHPVAEPPPADDDDINNGGLDNGIINTTPIDTEQLPAPDNPADLQQSQPEIAPPPPMPGEKKGGEGKSEGIKGVIERLNAAPPEPDAPEKLGPQKPDMPQQGGAPDEELLPR